MRNHHLLPWPLLLVACVHEVAADRSEGPIDAPELNPAIPTDLAPAVVLPGAPASLPGRCADGPRVDLTAAQRAKPGVRDAACVVEQLDAGGCVAARTDRRFDDAGRMTREEHRIVGDPAFVEAPHAYVVPARTDHVFTWRFGPSGELVDSTVDADGDGRLDAWTRHRSDAQGRPLDERRWHRDPGGWALSLRARTRWGDGAAPLLHEVFDAEGLTQRTTAEEDGRGQLLRRDTWHRGGHESRETWSRDWTGNVRHERREGPTGGEETFRDFDRHGLEFHRTWRRWIGDRVDVVERHQMQRDDAGVLRAETYERDDGGDGRVDQRRETVFDPAGREVEAAHDDGADGQVDWRRRQRWDAAGRQILFRVVVQGVVRTERTARFDDAGRILERGQYTDDGVGPADRFVERFTYDAAGHLAVTERRDASGRVWLRVTQRADSGGRPLSVERDQDGDGEADSIELWQYDAAGRPTRHVVDHDADGRADHTREMLYDQSGNPVLERFDSTGDGQPERWVLSTFACLQGAGGE